MSQHTTQIPLFTTVPSDPTQEIPYGYCHCGCGQRTTIASKTSRKRGRIKGQPVRYISGHNARQLPGWKYPKASASLSEALWLHAAQGSPDKCWPWNGPLNEDGYGWFRIGKRRYAAHRASYELHHGPIPKGKEVCHSCDNRRCVNPAHLWLGTHQENIFDMHKKNRHRGAKGEKNRHAKLTASQVIEIRRQFAVGKRRYELAREYKTSWSAIDAIVRRESWKHI